MNGGLGLEEMLRRTDRRTDSWTSLSTWILGTLSTCPDFRRKNVGELESPLKTN